MRDALGIEARRLSPNGADLASCCKAPVDLLFNGGIGTYVKAAEETNLEVGDRANDAVRVDGGQLRCRVVGEGGNLGLTQRGRIEYALRGGPDQSGGAINNDAIDNVAGVNCSDHEVNIKILLDGLVAAGELTVDRTQRAAGVDDRCRRRQGPVRQLHPDPGDVDRARPVGLDARRPRAGCCAIWSRRPGSTASSSSCPPRRR